MKKLLLLAAMGAMTLAACTKTVFVDPEPEVPARDLPGLNARKIVR